MTCLTIFGYFFCPNDCYVIICILFIYLTPAPPLFSGERLYNDLKWRVNFKFQVCLVIKLTSWCLAGGDVEDSVVVRGGTFVCSRLSSADVESLKKGKKKG